MFPGPACSQAQRAQLTPDTGGAEATPWQGIMLPLSSRMKDRITETLWGRGYKNGDYRRQREHGTSGYTSKETTKTSSIFCLEGGRFVLFKVATVGLSLHPILCTNIVAHHFLLVHGQPVLGTRPVLHFTVCCRSAPTLSVIRYCAELLLSLLLY